MSLEILMPPLVGAVIGYSTNWLAIKMLFKPKKEVRIMGKRLPFTPGLIPKEKDRIAESLGMAVGKKLLNEDVLIKELTSKDVIKMLEEYTKNNILDNEFSIDEIIDKMFGNKDLAYTLIAENVLNSLNQNLIHTNDFRESIFEKVDDFFQEDRKIDEKIILVVNEALNENKEYISDALKQMVSGESFEPKVKEIISTVVSEKLGALGAMFVNPDEMYITIRDTILQKLDEEETKLLLVEELKKAVSSISEKNLNELLSQKQMITISAVVSNKLEIVLQGYLETDELKDMLKNTIIEICKRPMEFSEDTKIHINNVILEEYENFANKRMPRFLEKFDLSGIVEKRIKDFNEDEIEELILNVAQRELNAITRLGALIGFIMGWVNVLF